MHVDEVHAVCDRVQIIHQGQIVLADSSEGLAQRMQTSTLRVVFGTPPDGETLLRIAGITRCEALDNNGFRLFFASDCEPTDALVEQAVAGGWQLRELVRERRTLEEIFSELTVAPPATHSERH